MMLFYSPSVQTFELTDQSGDISKGHWGHTVSYGGAQSKRFAIFWFEYSNQKSWDKQFQLKAPLLLINYH